MYIKVKVSPGAKKELFVRVGDTLFDISVKERPERNLANQRVKELLAEHFRLPVGKLRLVSGHHSRNKIFNVLALA